MKFVGRAVGMIETIGIATTIEATDVMLKTADVSILQQNKKDPALVTTYIEGDVSAVYVAIEAGKKMANRTGALVAFSVIPAADDQTIDSLIVE